MRSISTRFHYYVLCRRADMSMKDARMIANLMQGRKYDDLQSDSIARQQKRSLFTLSKNIFVA
jgi:hypothetical protein